jgi:hypothetical protein
MQPVQREADRYETGLAYKVTRSRPASWTNGESARPDVTLIPSAHHAHVIPASNFGLAMFIYEADVNLHFEQAALRSRCDGRGRR